MVGFNQNSAITHVKFKFSTHVQLLMHGFTFAGEEFYLRKDLKVKAFQTYHVIPSQVASQQYMFLLSLKLDLILLQTRVLF